MLIAPLRFYLYCGSGSVKPNRYNTLVWLCHNRFMMRLFLVRQSVPHGKIANRLALQLHES